jgi:hypothetical protein
MRALVGRLRPFLPWISLLSGIGGAFLMNRAPDRAWMVVAAAIAGFGILVAFHLAERAWGTAERVATGKKGARFALLLTSQMAVQQALLFPLPFYVRAAGLQLGHGVFFGVYAAALVVALWDPLFEAAMKRPLAVFALQAFAAFVGLDMVLPVFGLSNTTSLVVAAAVTAIAVPLLVLLELRPRTWPRRLLVVPAAAVVVIGARLAAPGVPPAPLELVHVGIGTGIESRELIGEARVLAGARELVCHSSIKAPLGLKDALLHVWKKDGRRLDAIAVEVSGGREAGFRTWSKKRSLGAHPEGVWTCSVETASGQVLGRVRAELRPSAS